MDFAVWSLQVQDWLRSDQTDIWILMCISVSECLDVFRAAGHVWKRFMTSQNCCFFSLPHLWPSGECNLYSLVALTVCVLPVRICVLDLWPGVTTEEQQEPCWSMISPGTIDCYTRLFTFLWFVPPPLFSEESRMCKLKNMKGPVVLLFILVNFFTNSYLSSRM